MKLKKIIFDTWKKIWFLNWNYRHKIFITMYSIPYSRVWSVVGCLIVYQDGNNLYPSKYSQTICWSQFGWYCLWGGNILMARPSTFLESRSWWGHDCGKSTTLESGINIPPWINVAPGKFGKNNKHSPIYTLFIYYLNRLYEVRNKAIAPGKKSKN